jgi:hypothetical protein
VADRSHQFVADISFTTFSMLQRQRAGPTDRYNDTSQASFHGKFDKLNVLKQGAEADSCEYNQVAHNFHLADSRRVELRATRRA